MFSNEHYKLVFELFKFQYGATNIFIRNIERNRRNRFKFQYGATNIALV